jgi:vacuolar protein sorting-associated protein 72
MNEYPLPPPPPKQRCAVTSWTAKFRDPKTGLAYADMHQYKVIQRVLAGGCAWSAMLGCWVGPNTVGMMGRPARGVPEGFAGKVVKTES